MYGTLRQTPYFRFNNNNVNPVETNEVRDYSYGGRGHYAEVIRDVNLKPVKFFSNKVINRVYDLLDADDRYYEIDQAGKFNIVEATYKEAKLQEKQAQEKLYENVDKIYRTSTSEIPENPEVIDQAVGLPSQDELNDILAKTVVRTPGMSDEKFQQLQEQARANPDIQGKLNEISLLNRELQTFLKYISALKIPLEQKKLMRDEAIKNYLRGSQRIIAPSFQDANAPIYNDSRQEAKQANLNDDDAEDRDNIRIAEEASRQVFERGNGSSREMLSERDILGSPLRQSMNRLSDVVEEVKRLQPPSPPRFDPPVAPPIAPPMAPPNPPDLSERKTPIKPKSKSKKTEEVKSPIVEKPTSQVLLEQAKKLKKPKPVEQKISQSSDDFNDVLKRAMAARAAVVRNDDDDFDEVVAPALIDEKYKENLINKLVALIVITGDDQAPGVKGAINKKKGNPTELFKYIRSFRSSTNTFEEALGQSFRKLVNVEKQNIIKAGFKFKTAKIKDMDYSDLVYLTKQL